MFSSNTFHSSLKENAFDKVIYEVEKKLADGETVEPFVSSVYIKPKMNVESHKTEIEIRNQPFKKTIYTTGITIYVSFNDIQLHNLFHCFFEQRRFEAISQPFIEVPANSDDENNNKIVYETTISINL